MVMGFFGERPGEGRSKAFLLRPSALQEHHYLSTTISVTLTVP